jgi:predicted Zn-dependent protease
MLDVVAKFREIAPPADYWCVRTVDDRVDEIMVRRDVVEPLLERRSLGVMVTVVSGTGHGWAATGDLTPSGLRAAAERALDLARTTAARPLFDAALLPRPRARGSHASVVGRPWASVALRDRVTLTRDACRRLDAGERIVDRIASLVHRATDVAIFDSDGSSVEQRFAHVRPLLVAVANEGSVTQRRTHAGDNCARQGGFEQIDALGFTGVARPLAEQALALLAAPECPEGVMSVVLMPGQMALQVHESIGHPLELDRILGDERNYAGTSFVTPDMFGSYRYGSELLNVTFDTSRAEEAASYAYDDEGTAAETAYLIREGVLLRPLGGALSQARSGLAGVACARACGWQRPPIDRMGNVNLEPGASSLAELIARAENGVLMDVNRSWSIDETRDKFQFGCEVGWMIRDGKLAELVRNPGYRGRAASFWRSLAGVGRRETVEVWGPTNCGKGEPNQAIHVGHATPPCLFYDVEVFGAG